MFIAEVGDSFDTTLDHEFGAFIAGVECDKNFTAVALGHGVEQGVGFGMNDIGVLGIDPTLALDVSFPWELRLITTCGKTVVAGADDFVVSHEHGPNF